MNRAEKAERRAVIKQLYAEGASVEELSKKYGLTKEYIYIFAGDGKRIADRPIGILRERADEVRELLAQGMAGSQVGEKFGVSRFIVYEFCKENGIQLKNHYNSEADVVRKVRDKTQGLLEYISGYKNRISPIKVRCTVCGGEFERSYHDITAKGYVSCPYCVDRKREQKRAEAERTKEEQRAKTAEKREQHKREKEERRAEVERRRIERIHRCPVCGEITDNPKYCSVKCRNKAHNTTHEHSRRIKIQSGMIDSDITLQGLFNRDRGVCQLCGKPCDWEDIREQDGALIAGDNYPSIDHILPLSSGGEHSWENVRLAHRRCNTLEYWKRLKFNASSLPIGQ